MNTNQQKPPVSGTTDQSVSSPPHSFTITVQCTTNTNWWKPPFEEHDRPICEVLLATPFLQAVAQTIHEYEYQSHQPMKASHEWHDGPIGCALNVDIGHTYTH